MSEKLTNQEIDLLLESLKYTREAFESYEHYPSYEFKQQRVKEVDDLRAKLIRLKV
ncbi:MAG: hypothetical protein GY805_31010 [Chloroflexi bacterium]|nr:hypothetical protein [Chloroflexota bacterium]